MRGLEILEFRHPLGIQSSGEKGKGGAFSHPESCARGWLYRPRLFCPQGFVACLESAKDGE